MGAMGVLMTRVAHAIQAAALVASATNRLATQVATQVATTPARAKQAVELRGAGTAHLQHPRCVTTVKLERTVLQLSQSAWAAQ